MIGSNGKLHDLTKGMVDDFLNAEDLHEAYEREVESYGFDPNAVNAEANKAHMTVQLGYGGGADAFMHGFILALRGLNEGENHD